VAEQRLEEYAAPDESEQSMLFDVALEQEEYETEVAAADAAIMEELDAIRAREKDQPKKRKTSPSKPKTDGTGVRMKASEVPKGGILPKRLHDEPAALSSSMPLRLASGVAKTVKAPSETTSATRKAADTTTAGKGKIHFRTNHCYEERRSPVRGNDSCEDKSVSGEIASAKKGKVRGSPAMGVTPDRHRKLP